MRGVCMYVSSREAMLAQEQKVRSTQTMAEHLQKIKRYGNASRLVGEGLGVARGASRWVRLRNKTGPISSCDVIERDSEIIARTEFWIHGRCGASCMWMGWWLGNHTSS